jgi:hypothetical protein
VCGQGLRIAVLLMDDVGSRVRARLEQGIHQATGLTITHRFAKLAEQSFELVLASVLHNNDLQPANHQRAPFYPRVRDAAPHRLPYPCCRHVVQVGKARRWPLHPLVSESLGGLNGSTQHSGQTRPIFETKTKSLAGVRSFAS